MRFENLCLCLIKKKNGSKCPKGRFFQNGEIPPFKISRDNVDLSHSFLVSHDESGKVILGVIALSNENEGILGHGDYGLCKLVLWQDGKMNALKIEPKIDDKYEIEIMQKLGLIREHFKRSWKKRKNPETSWINNKQIKTKRYKIISLVKGVNVENYLASLDIPLTMEQRRELFISLLNAVKVLHDKGIIHNDLHFQNIMLNDNMMVHLIDFGKSIDLEKIPQKIEELQSRFGRSDTQAPEIKAFWKKLNEAVAMLGDDVKLVNFKMPISTASDIYSLGIIFTKMFGELQESPTVDELVTGMLNLNPAQRPSIDTLLSHLNSENFKEEVEGFDKENTETLTDITTDTENENYDKNILPEDYPDELLIKTSSEDITTTSTKPRRA